MDQQTVLSAVSSTPLGEALVDFLRKRGAVPSMRPGYLGDDVLGRFDTNTAFGTGLGKAGEVVFSHGFDPTVPQYRGVAVHELTHAAERQMANMYFERPKTLLGGQEPTQFSEAFQKLRLQDDPLIKQMPESYKKEHGDYRLKLSEALAYGAGSVTGDRAYPIRLPSGGHLDTTKATELAILLELANRTQEKK